jgi:hypothetical protein
MASPIPAPTLLLHRVLPVVVALHGLVHLLGVAKGFGWADISELRQPISTGLALAWLAAAVAVLGSAVLLVVQHRWWRPALAVAAVASQVVITTSWSDARAGTAVNVLMLLAAGYGLVRRERGPLSRPDAGRRPAPTPPRR